MNTDPKPNVASTAQPYTCPICGEASQTPRGLSIHGAKRHNVEKLQLYLLRFPDAQRNCNCGQELKFIDQERGFQQRCGACSRHEKTVGRPTWNAGLTKDTDARMNASAASMRKHYATNAHHALGKTKLNHATVLATSQKISERLKAHYDENEHWSKGLTVITSDVIAKRTASITATARAKKWIFTAQQRLRMREAKLLDHASVQARLLEHGLSMTLPYVDMATVTELSCTKCNTVLKRNVGFVLFNDGKCPKCHPPWACKTSAWQQEIFDFVLTIEPEATLNDRTQLDGLELDIYVPSKRFAVECNGLYWHSEAVGRFEPDHAEKKRLACESVGIRLLTLFEDEWRDKRSIVESMIRHRLGATPRRVGARLLAVELCPAIDLKQFINENHIDGYARATFGIRLTLGHETLGACTLRIPTHGQIVGSLEIARMCFLRNVHVQGGVGTIIAAAVQLGKNAGFERLVSYSDGRFGGGCYNGIMVLDRVTKPRFWWTDWCNRYDRFTTRADAPAGITEADAAATTGVTRLYGCSNRRWSIRLT